jgi:hypothetical protein
MGGKGKDGCIDSTACIAWLAGWSDVYGLSGSTHSVVQLTDRSLRPITHLAPPDIIIPTSNLPPPITQLINPFSSLSLSLSLQVYRRGQPLLNGSEYRSGEELRVRVEGRSGACLFLLFFFGGGGWDCLMCVCVCVCVCFNVCVCVCVC